MTSDDLDTIHIYDKKYYHETVYTDKQRPPIPQRTHRHTQTQQQTQRQTTTKKKKKKRKGKKKENAPRLFNSFSPSGGSVVASYTETSMVKNIQSISVLH